MKSTHIISNKKWLLALLFAVALNPCILCASVLSESETKTVRIISPEARWIDSHNLGLRFSSCLETDLKSSGFVSIKPIYVCGSNDTIAFPVFSYFSERGYKYYKRRRSFSIGKAEPGIIIQNGSSDKSGRVYLYNDTLHAVSGDTDGMIYFLSILSDCCNSRTTCVDSISVPCYSVPLPVFEKKQQETVTDTIEACIFYPQNEYRLLPDYMGNGISLDRFLDGARNIIADTSGCRILSFTVVGYASPEGVESRNVFLSYRRAQHLASLLYSGNISRETEISVSGAGIRWEHLPYNVHSAKPYTKEFMNFVETYSTYSETGFKTFCKDKSHAYLNRYIYPYLRVSVVRIIYQRKEDR